MQNFYQTWKFNFNKAKIRDHTGQPLKIKWIHKTANN